MHGWAALYVLLALIVLGTFFALAWGWFFGYPETPQKNLTLFTAPGDKSPLALYVHPPIARLFAEDPQKPVDTEKAQLLTFQFTNRGTAALRVENPSIPDDCFRLTSETGGESSVLDIGPQQSTVAIFRLNARSKSPSSGHSCLGDRPLVVRYTWNVSDAGLRSELNSLFPTTQTPAGFIITIPDVRFQTDKSALRPATRDDLTRVAEALQRRLPHAIKIEGYTDSTGTEIRNLKLSRDRAAAVRDFLVSHGIPPAILSANGFGSTNPIASNSSSQGRARNRRVYLQLTEDVHNDAAVSSGPIHVTTLSQVSWERFFHLLAVVLLPALVPFSIWFAGYVVQKTQEKRAKLQADQDRDLEVWKTVLPGIIKAIRNHYIPMLSIISVMMSETSKQPAQANLDNVLTCALLFRNRLTNMVWHSGGFYFKSMRAEQICASLCDAFFDYCYELSGDQDTFRRSADKLPKNCSFIQAKDLLQIATPAAAGNPVSRMARHAAALRASGTAATMYGAFKAELLKPAQLRQFNHYLEMISGILGYEVNRPFYPQWYDEPPKVDTSKWTIEGLGLNAETAEALKQELDSYLNYLKGVPTN